MVLKNLKFKKSQNTFPVNFRYLLSHPLYHVLAVTCLTVPDAFRLFLVHT